PLARAAARERSKSLARRCFIGALLRSGSEPVSKCHDRVPTQARTPGGAAEFTPRRQTPPRDGGGRQPSRERTVRAATPSTVVVERVRAGWGREAASMRRPAWRALREDPPPDVGQPAAALARPRSPASALA